MPGVTGSPEKAIGTEVPRYGGGDERQNKSGENGMEREKRG